MCNCMYLCMHVCVRMYVYALGVGQVCIGWAGDGGLLGLDPCNNRLGSEELDRGFLW
jgi:hypothetical protein